MKKWLRLLLQLLSLILFAAILWWAGPDAWQLLLQSNPQDLLWFFGIYAISGIVSASRLRLITKALTGQQWASWRQYYYVNWSARALGLVLPRSISGVAGKSVGLKAFGVSLNYTVWIVLVDNLFDVGVLAAFTLPGVLFIQGSLNGVELVMGLTAVSLIMAAAVWWGTRTDLLQAVLLRIPFFKKRLPDQSVERLLPSSMASLQAFLYTLLLNGILASSFFVMARAINLNIPLPLVIATYPIVQLSLVAAVTPGGLGLFELGWIGLLVLGGLSQADAVAFSVAQRALVFVNVLLWAAISVLVSMTDRRKKISSIP